MKNKIVLLLLVVILFIAAWALGKKNSQPSMTENSLQQQEMELPLIKVSVTKSVEDNHFALDYAISNGYFKKQGLDVEIVDADKIPYALLEAGETDVMMGGINRPLSVFFNGAEPRLIMNAFRPFGVYAVSCFDREHANEIKRVIVNVLGGENQKQVDLALTNLGLDPSVLEHVAVTTPQARIAMMLNGEADFSIINSRSIYDENEQLHAFTLLGSDVTQKNSKLARSIVTTKNIIEKKAGLLEKFVIALSLAIDQMQEDKEGSVMLAMKEFSMNEDQANDFYEQFMRGVQSINRVPEASDLKDILEEAKKDAADPGKDIDMFVYPSFAEKAQIK